MAGNFKKLVGKKKLPLIIGAVVLIVALIVGGKVLGGGKPGAKHKGAASVEVGLSYPLDEFLVNLDGGGDHYLRASVTLGLRKGATEEEAKERTAPIRDTILSILSAQTISGLTKEKVREALKETIKQKVNQALGEEYIVKVYFTAFATQ